jgi:hypothetical protein
LAWDSGFLKVFVGLFFVINFGEELLDVIGQIVKLFFFSFDRFNAISELIELLGVFFQELGDFDFGKGLVDGVLIFVNDADPFGEGVVLFDDFFVDDRSLFGFFLIVFELTFVHTVDSMGIGSSPLVAVHVSVLAIGSLLLVDHVPHFLESVADLFVIFLDDLNFKIEFFLTSI